MIKRAISIATVFCAIALPPAMAQAGNAPGTAPGAGMVPGRQAPTAAKLSPADKAFADEASRANWAEIKLSQIAQQKATRPDIKAFAQKMIRDHSQAEDTLKQAVSCFGINLPDNLDAKHAALAAKLSQMSGAGFDKAYMSAMVKDHKIVLATLKKKSLTAGPELSAWARQTRPVIEGHLRLALEIVQK